MLGRDSVDGLAALHSPEVGPGSEAETDGFVGVELSRPFVLEEDVPKRLSAVRDRDGSDLVSVALEHVTALELVQLELEPHASGGAQHDRHQLAQSPGTRDPQRPLATAQVEG